MGKEAKNLASYTHTLASLRTLLGLNGLVAGSFTDALPTETIATDKVYQFAGTNATAIGGITWYNGDSALYNGSTWTRIPFQSLSNYFQKSETNIYLTEQPVTWEEGTFGAEGNDVSWSGIYRSAGWIAGSGTYAVYVPTSASSVALVDSNIASSTGGSYDYRAIGNWRVFTVTKGFWRIKCTIASSPTFKVYKISDDLLGAKINVKVFKALGDGVADDTIPIQTAIDYATIKGGGELYFPKGVYLLNTIQTGLKVTGNLILRDRDATIQTKTIQITFTFESIGECIGQYIYMGTGPTAPDGFMGSILYSTSTCAVNDGTSMPPAVIACDHNEAVIFYGNYNRYVFNNMHIRVTSGVGTYPLLSGLNLAFCMCPIVNGVYISTDIHCSVFTAPSADDHYSAAIMYSRRFSDPFLYAEKIVINAPFRYGLICAEGGQYNGVTIFNCENGIGVGRGAHVNHFVHINMQNVKNHIAALQLTNMFAAYEVNTSAVKIDMIEVEIFESQVPEAFNHQYFVDDPANNLKGLMTYLVCAASQTIVKNGGTNLVCTSILP